MGANGGTPSVHADELDAVTLLAKGCIRQVDRRVLTGGQHDARAERGEAQCAAALKGFGSFALPADQLPSGSHDVALVRIESIYFLQRDCVILFTWNIIGIEYSYPTCNVASQCEILLDYAADRSCGRLVFDRYIMIGKHWGRVYENPLSLFEVCPGNK